MDKQSYRYLLPVDGSIYAARAAEYIARYASRLAPCEVSLLNVQPPENYRAEPQRRNEILREAIERGEAAAATARQYLDQAAILYRFETKLGEPAATIAGAAQADGCDEIVIGTRGLGAAESLVLGSVAYKVIHLAAMPVTVVPNPKRELHLRPADDPAVHRVLLAVDGSEHAANAAKYVCTLRDACIPVEIHALNVQLPIVSGNVRQFVSQAMVDSYHHEEGEAAVAPATKILEAAGFTYQRHIVVGHPAQTIVEQAQTLRCTRVVMGTRGLGGIASVALGSVAFKAVHLADLPVTLVK